MKSFTVSKSFNIRPEKGSSRVKTWKLELTVPEGTTMRDLALSVLASEVIKVQNANRSKFDKFPDRHVFKKTFNRPGIQEDPKAAVKAELKTLNPEERRKYIEDLLKGIEDNGERRTEETEGEDKEGE